MLVAHPYVRGTTLCWWYKQLLSKSIPTLVVHPYAGGTTLRWCYWCRWPLLDASNSQGQELVQSVAFLWGLQVWSASYLVRALRKEAIFTQAPQVAMAAGCKKLYLRICFSCLLIFAISATQAGWMALTVLLGAKKVIQDHGIWFACSSSFNFQLQHEH